MTTPAATPRSAARRTRILVVDDEPAIVRAVSIALEAHGHDVDAASGGRQAVAKASAANYDAIVLDLGLPDIDGTEVIRRIRAMSSDVPILVLSAWDDMDMRVEALDLGADDFIPKPFGMPELLARLRVVLRHVRRGDSDHHTRKDVVELGGVRIDLGRRRVQVDGRDVELTRTQFDVLAFLAEHPERVLTHRVIAAAAWRDGSAVDPQNLRVVISQIRKRIEADPTQPKRIVTELGIGYRFEPGP